MSVDDREIPIAHLPKSVKLLPRQGNQSISHEFEEGGKKYVYKELRHDNEDYKVLGSDPKEVARISNVFYLLLKKHFGDEVVSTNYIVSTDREGKLTVVAIQPKVEGDSLLKIVDGGDGNDAVVMNQVVEMFEQRLGNVFEDPEYKEKLPKEAQEYFLHSAQEIKLDNIIKTPANNYVMVDF